MKKIIVYGPSDKNIPQHKIGGAEVGTKRTIDILKKNNYQVILINKPTLYYGKLRYIIDYLKAKRLVKKFTKEKDAIFYCIGFYYRNGFVEKKFINIAKKNGCKIIYEPKNGSLISSLENGEKKYRLVMNDIFNNSDVVFCQGKKYKDYLDKMYVNKAIYIPNYIKDELIEQNKLFNEESLDLVYWGRITKSKNVDLMVEIFDKISKKIDKKVTLTLIGSFDEHYFKLINDKIKNTDYPSNVHFVGRSNLNTIKEIVQNKHFYLFPSMEKNEGHSNALTESMAFGLVPIVSDCGFNKDVLGINDLVIDNLDSDIYANKIIEIYLEKKYIDYSKKVICKVENNYIEKIVSNKIIETIKTL